MRAMKNSGTVWIGKMPNDWKLDKLGNYFTERKEKVSDVDYEPLSVSKGGIVQQLEGVAKTKNNDDRKRVAVGDFAINSRSDRKQSCGLSSLEGSVSVINTVLTPRNIEPEFVKYLLDNYGFAEEFFRWGSGIHFDLWSTRFTQMKSILLPVPIEKVEQQKISNYLDQKVALIDNIIKKTKESIEEYKKYKQSLITETVTKGLNPDVMMKDSGIEWIGEIPEHWEVAFLSQVYFQVKNKNDGNQESNLLSLSYGNIIRKDINTTDGLLPENFEGYNIVEKNDIVLRLTDLQNDHKSLRVGLVTERGIITSAYITIRNRIMVNSDFMYYFMHSFDICKGFYGMGSGVRQGLTFDGIKSFKFVIPPLAEQCEIVKFLTDKANKIDDLIEEKLKLITELESYKKSLIYEVVTGKLEIQ